MNAACGSPFIEFNGFQTGTGPAPGPGLVGGHPTTGYNFVGWCFNGGDPVYVYLVDDSRGGEILGETTVTAAPDNNWIPGGIQGSIAYPFVAGNGATDHVHFIAVDPLIGIAQSSCFIDFSGLSC